MARISMEDADRYYSGSNSEWFQLKNDGDVARVQFMFDDVSEIPAFSTHRVKIGDKERQVDCLRSPREPIEKCPLCAAGIPCKAAKFVLMYQHDDGKVKIWERGRQFISKLQGLVNRYSPLSQHVFEIERHGKAGDTSTKYEVYPLDGVEPVNISDLEDPTLEGTIILTKSFEEMEEYLETGAFPETDDTQPVTRRGSAPAPSRGGSTRRAPATPPQSTGVSRRGTPPAAATTGEAPAPSSRVSRRGAAPKSGTEVF